MFLFCRVSQCLCRPGILLSCSHFWKDYTSLQDMFFLRSVLLNPGDKTKQVGVFCLWFWLLCFPPYQVKTASCQPNVSWKSLTNINWPVHRHHLKLSKHCLPHKGLHKHCDTRQKRNIYKGYIERFTYWPKILLKQMISYY